MYAAISGSYARELVEVRWCVAISFFSRGMITAVTGGLFPVLPFNQWLPRAVNLKARLIQLCFLLSSIALLTSWNGTCTLPYFFTKSSVMSLGQWAIHTIITLNLHAGPGVKRWSFLQCDVWNSFWLCDELHLKSYAHPTKVRSISPSFRHAERGRNYSVRRVVTFLRNFSESGIAVL